MILIHELPDGSLALTTEIIPGSFIAPDGWAALPSQPAHLLPTVFRDCWRWDHANACVIVDMALARAAKMVEIRAERDKRLTASDGKKARLDDIGTAEQKAAMADYRATLRDIPVAAKIDTDLIDNPLTLSTYAPVWPTEPQ